MKGPGEVAERLMRAYDEASTLPPITSEDASFDVAAAYAVLHAIESRRIAGGWRPLGRKIGFTNRTLWERYGVDRPLWAHVFESTVQEAPDGRARIPLRGLVQPRIEPEVVFGLSGPVSPEAAPREVLESVAWMAPGFEIVQCHFPGWKFRPPDCIAAFGLHGRLVVGPRVALDDRHRDALVATLESFEVDLYRGEALIERGRGSHVLGSPALALRYLARTLAEQPWAAPLAAGEIVTTGTLTDAWPVAAGERWHSAYGSLGLPGIALEIA